MTSPSVQYNTIKERDLYEGLGIDGRTKLEGILRYRYEYEELG